MESLHSLLQPKRENPHPSRPQWDLYLLHELPPSQQQRLEQHVQTCHRCQDILHSLHQERDQFLQHADLPMFTQKIANLSHIPNHRDDVPVLREMLSPRRSVGDEFVQPDTIWQRWQRWFRPALWTTTSVAVGAVALLFVIYPVLFTSNHPKPSTIVAELCTTSVPDPRVRRKGIPSLSVYVSRNHAVQSVVSGSNFYAGDLLALRYHASGYRYLSILHVDPKQQVSWLYPQQPGPGIPIAAQGDLQGSLELDGAKGTEYLLAVFSSHPLPSSVVQHLLRKRSQSAHQRLSCASSHAVFMQTFVLNKP